ncbi:MAG: hypothetical protein IT331_23260 [Anaerolineae bacterium]|nr:hypothetical protein [Anaerolineae bacterium]
MPILLLIPFIAVILYFFLPHHILSRSGSRTTWLIRGFVFFNGLAYWVGSEPWLGTFMNPLWQLVLRFFFLEICYVLALAALYTIKGWQMPRIVAAAILAFYGIWIVVCLQLLQTSLPPFANVDATLYYTSPAFILLRVSAALSTVVLFLELTRCLVRLWKGDRFLAGRLRFGFLTFGTVLAFVNRLFVLVHIGTVLTASEWSALALTLEKNINLAATVFFLAGCLPPLIIERVARALIYLDQQRAILELAILRAALVHSTAPLPWPLPDWRTRLNQPAYVLYSSMIDVLDRLLLLESLPASATLHLDGVEAIHDPIAPDELLERLRQMARRLWFKQWTVRLRQLILPFPIEPTA